MSQFDECLPSALLPPSKKAFFDISDSDSIPSETCLSRNSSFGENQGSPLQFLTSSKVTSAEYQLSDICLPESAENQQDFEEENISFPEDLYDRIEDFLDNEGLFPVEPESLGSPQIKSPMIVLLPISSCFKSEDGIKLDFDSPLSDNSQGPSFLARRNGRMGLKSTFSALAMTQMRSEGSEPDSAATPCYTSLTKRTCWNLKNAEISCGNDFGAENEIC